MMQCKWYALLRSWSPSNVGVPIASIQLDNQNDNKWFVLPTKEADRFKGSSIFCQRDCVLQHWPLNHRRSLKLLKTTTTEKKIITNAAHSYKKNIGPRDCYNCAIEWIWWSHLVILFIFIKFYLTKTIIVVLSIYIH